MAPPSQLGLLLTTARLRTRHRLGHHSLRSVGLLVGLAATCLLVGLAVVPSAVVRGSNADPGGPMLEMAFWLTGLASAVVSFRIMERLFRTGDARLLAALPIRPAPLFGYRLLGSLAEAMLIVLAAAALFAPMLWRGDPSLYLACLWVWLSGMLLTVFVGLAVQMYAGVSTVRGDGQFGAFGPMAFALAPGIALAIAVSLVLIEKLVAEEFLRGGFNKGAKVGLAIAGVASVVSLWLALGWFRKHFHAVFARFLEADLFIVDVDYAYFKEGPLVARGWERWMDAALVPLVRKDRLQLRRRHALARIFVWLLAVALGAFLLARGGDALPLPLVVSLPLLVVAVFANPCGNLFSPELERGLASTLPVTTRVQGRAKLLVAARETLELALPMVVAVAIGMGRSHWGWTLGLGLGALSGIAVTAPIPALVHVAQRLPAATLGVGFALAVLTFAVAAVSVAAILPLALVLLCGAYLVAPPAAWASQEPRA